METVDLYGEDGIKIGVTAEGDSVHPRDPDAVVIVAGHSLYACSAAEANRSILAEYMTRKRRLQMTTDKDQIATRWFAGQSFAARVAESKQEKWDRQEREIYSARQQRVTAAAWAEYQRVKAAALAEYQRVRAAALAEYERVTAAVERVKAAAWAEYERVTAAAWAEYQRVKAPALAEYQRVRAAALAEYERVTAAEDVKVTQ